MNSLKLVPFTQQELYDRIIDVTLIRKAIPDIQGIYTDVQYNPNKGTSLSTIDAKRRVILEGNSHFEIEEVNNEPRRKTVVAKGVVYSYDLNNPSDYDSFRSGRSPTGVILEVGDRCLVNDKGVHKEYHVAVVDTEQLYTVQDYIHIVCPDTGLKPYISFSVNVIPGQHCYAMDLKIRNLNLDIPIRQFNKVIVRAGYRSDSTMQEFECDIFSSYVEQANPDGITVFRCITCGKTNAFLHNHPIHVRYLGGTSTLDDLIKGTANLLNLQAYDYLNETYRNLPIGISMDEQARDTYADNAMALIDWMREIITHVICGHDNIDARANPEQNPLPVVTLTSDGLYVYCVNRTNSDITKEGKAASNSGYTITDLDAVKGATFNGVALTVASVWNPQVRPGRVFRMKPNIINGANLPNSMEKRTYGADEESGNLYRALTVNINFGTTDDINEMTVMAVPLVYIEEYESDSASRLTFDTWAAGKQDATANEMILTIGKADSSQQDEKGKTLEQQKQKALSMFNLKLSNVMGIRTYSAIEVKDGYTLSGVAQTYYTVGSEWLGEAVDCNPSKLTNCRYIKDIPGCNLWPLIAVYTYEWNQRQQGSTNNKWASFQDMMNPNLIHVGEWLCVPKIEDMKQLAKGIKVFQYAVEAYKGIPGYTNWINTWETLIEYLRTYQ